MSDIAKPKKRNGWLQRLVELRRNESGVALIEFAYSLPIFIGLGMYGTETAHRAVAQMQVSQAALAPGVWAKPATAILRRRFKKAMCWRL
jgi:hypothetical protein